MPRRCRRQWMALPWSATARPTWSMARRSSSRGTPQSETATAWKWISRCTPERRRPDPLLRKMSMNTPPSLADLVVIGDASIDHYIRVPHLAQNDNKAIGNYLGALGGGMSANLAAAAAALGAKTRLITKVGVDPEGTEALQILQSLGVETSFSVRDYSHRTWLCFIQLDETGEKALTGADTGIKVPGLSEIDQQAIRRARIVAPLADDLTWATDIARVATEAGARVAIDLEPDAFHPGDTALADLLARTNIVLLNEASASKLADHDPDQAAEAVHAYGPGTVVVSRGQGGASCSIADGPASRATQRATADVVDT